ncbi:hypothetical protein [Rhizobium sullae]|uniref:hypothetical protein n=1 Tax=Rhizobium sullae TaxID=50338 RepID=UPI001053D9CA|nr:hypothetical protein [Rhizobium sullae]
MQHATAVLAFSARRIECGEAFCVSKKREIIPKATKVPPHSPEYFQMRPIFDGKFLKLSNWKNFLRIPLLSANKYRSIGPLIGNICARSPKIKKEQTWETKL